MELLQRLHLCISLVISRGRGATCMSFFLDAMLRSSLKQPIILFILLLCLLFMAFYAIDFAILSASN